jgi:hypothetical protein
MDIGIEEINHHGLHSRQDGRLPRCHHPGLPVDLLWCQGARMPQYLRLSHEETHDIGLQQAKGEGPP